MSLGMGERICRQMVSAPCEGAPMKALPGVSAALPEAGIYLSAGTLIMGSG